MRAAGGAARQSRRATLLDHGVATIWRRQQRIRDLGRGRRVLGRRPSFEQALARPAQPLLMTKLAFETQASRTRRQPCDPRGSAAGLWRYGRTWSGDNSTAWKTLRFNLAQGLNMVLSGMFNTTRCRRFPWAKAGTGIAGAFRRVRLSVAALRDEFRGMTTAERPRPSNA